MNFYQKMVESESSTSFGAPVALVNLRNMIEGNGTLGALLPIFMPDNKNIKDDPVRGKPNPRNQNKQHPNHYQMKNLLQRHFVAKGHKKHALRGEIRRKLQEYGPLFHFPSEMPKMSELWRQFSLPNPTKSFIDDHWREQCDETELMRQYIKQEMDVIK